MSVPSRSFFTLWAYCSKKNYAILDAMNKKLYFGEPLKAAVRDDLSEEDFQRLLRAPGVLFVRNDVILES